MRSSILCRTAPPLLLHIAFQPLCRWTVSWSWRMARSLKKESTRNCSRRIMGFIKNSGESKRAHSLRPRHIARLKKRGDPPRAFDNFHGILNNTLLLINQTRMARVSTYLNFPRTTEEAFNFYKSVFGGEFTDGIHRMGEVPSQEGQPPLP